MKVLIIGASKSGSSICRLLLKKDYEVYITDSNVMANREELEKLGAQVYDNGHPDFLKEIDYNLIVKNPGIPYNVDFVRYFTDRGYLMYNEIEVASTFADYSYGAITGTNGKTTTTTLLGEFLKEMDSDNGAVGNIGLPLSDVVMEKGDRKLTLAVEVAAFQLLGMPTFKPKVSTIMNLTPDHLNYFDSVDDYYQAKCLIYRNQDENDYFIKNIDDENINNYVKDLRAQTLTLSLEKDADLTIRDGIAWFRDTQLFSLKDFRLVGRHNLYNALTAAAMAYLLGVPTADIQKVISGFKGVEHRLEFVREKDNVRFYNDSKGTNTDATIVALKAFDQPVILLAGGYDKKTGFNDLIPYLDRVKTMIVFGETKYQLKDIYHDAIVLDTMEEAIAEADRISQSGDVVLLSPSCASWDQFDNFEQRGEIFKDIVRKL